MRTPLLTTAAQTLVAEAAEWRLIELLFRCPADGRWRHAVKSLADEIHHPDLRAAAMHAVAEANEGIYHSIFGPGGPAPAREASYQATVQLGYLMSELKAYYEAFAYSPVSGAGGDEPPDHVSVEAGFMGFLQLKQAFALATGSEDDAALAAEAANRFRSEHLSNIAVPLSYALDHSGQRYLELAGKALLRRAGPARKRIFDVLDQEGAHTGECALECGDI